MSKLRRIKGIGQVFGSDQKRAPNAGRSITVFDDDIFIVSYPKSGNTWLRFLIGNMIYPEKPTSFVNLEQRVPDIHRHSDKELERIERPRYLKSHEYFHPRYPRVVYLVRDPRDVAVSYYHHLQKVRRLPDDYPIADYVRAFVSGEWNSFGSWGEHVGSWMGARERSAGFLVIRYEDMLLNPHDQLGKICEFSGIEASTGDLGRSISESAAERMRELELAQSDLWVTTRETRKDIAFIRQAASGAWRTEIPEACAEAIQAAWAGWMTSLGYLQA